MTRFALALALLLGGLVFAQPVAQTYFVPIAARTDAGSVGPNAMQTSLGLPDPGVGADQSYLFGTGSGASVPFLLGTLQVATLTQFPTQVDAVVTAPAVRVGGRSKTLVAFSSSGQQVMFATISSGSFQGLVTSGPTIPASARIALSATPDGGAALLSTDGFQITRWDLDLSGTQVVVTQGLTINASAVGATDLANALYFDGISNLGFVGGGVNGDIYVFDARLDAGQPTVFDVALVSQNRLAPPVTGLTAYVGQSAYYLLAANSQGVTIYDLMAPTPRASGFRVIPQDDAGVISGPFGVAVTNLPAGPRFPAGVIAVGDRSQGNLALVRWDTLANLVNGDGGSLIIDTTFDPRGDGGVPDGGCDGGACCDGGSCGPNNNPGPPNNLPIGPSVPVDHSSSCSTAAGGPTLLAALAALLLLVPRRRQRR